MALVVALDTSVIVASLLTWHEHHAPSLRALEAAMDGGQLAVPVPALVESYAVITRLPAPHRLSARDAHALLESNFAASTRADGLTGPECWAMLASLAAQSIAGGRAYDAQILAAAVKSRAKALLTLNVKDFAALARDDIEIRSPLSVGPT
ncbi:MAG TPA: PIN domain-containing protein [Anaeromyxobacteraceae bacterium]|nr:PIN domain-containing protein [Anaeromyxobacteraceae bacterium]